MKNSLAIILLVFCMVSGLADNRTDSLILKLNKSKADTNKAILYVKVARDLLYADAKKALMYADTAEQLSKKLGYQRGICKAFMVKGIYYRNAGEYEKGFVYQFDAIKIADKLGDVKMQAAGYTNLGILFKNQGNYKKSIGYLKESMKKFAIIGDKKGIANCYQNMSNTYRRDKQIDQAIKCSFEAFNLFKAEHDAHGEMSAYSSLGAVYMEDKKDYEKALFYYKKAEAISENDKDLNGKAVCYQNLGDCYYLMKNFKLAEEYTKKSIAAGKLLRNNEQEAANYLNLASIEEAMGNTRLALEYYKRFHELNDSAAKSRYNQSTLELEERFHSEKSKNEIELLSNLNEFKTKENSIQKSEIKKNRIIIFCGILFTIIIAFLAFLFFKNFKKTQKLNGLLTNTNLQIEYQKKEILDSIMYARRIQDSILPKDEELIKLLPKHFIIYKPRDIVSGDFYWTTSIKRSMPGSAEENDMVYVGLCDCTGHGVPGAFMSLISYTLLNQAIKDAKCNSPDLVLDYLAKELPIALKSEGHAGDLRDGLDVAITLINRKDLTIECSMAHIPVYICDGKTLRFIKPDKQSISADNYDKTFKFSLQKVQLQKGERVYLSTDGFADQFGGPKGKKLKNKELEKLLVETHSLSLLDQKRKLELFFDQWKGNLEQVDDVTLIGFEV
ncbi:MAG: tetratricopeptide repeat protein [Bacteroidetes bacterium]|nr:tetratricopeptide repeat protein [Bacteroidota bacterium]